MVLVVLLHGDKLRCGSRVIVRNTQDERFVTQCNGNIIDLIRRKDAFQILETIKSIQRGTTIEDQTVGAPSENTMKRWENQDTTKSRYA